MAGIPKKLKAALLAVTIAGGGVGGYQEMTRQSLIHLENIAYLPYRDIAGVLTVCVGHTGPDIEMRRYSHAECMALLDSDLKPVYAAIDRLVRVPLTPYQKTALATFIFNTGVTAFSNPSFRTVWMHTDTTFPAMWFAARLTGWQSSNWSPWKTCAAFMS
ncbi:glycoside hydrolase family protein [Escherichia coli]